MLNILIISCTAGTFRLYMKQRQGHIEQRLNFTLMILLKINTILINVVLNTNAKLILELRTSV